MLLTEMAQKLISRDKKKHGCAEKKEKKGLSKPFYSFLLKKRLRGHLLRDKKEFLILKYRRRQWTLSMREKN